MSDSEKQKLTPKERFAVMATLGTWHKQILDTSPADRPVAENAAKGVYRLLSRPEPRIVWAPSPADAVQAAGRELRSMLAPRIIIQMIWRLSRMTNRWRIPLAELAESARQDALQPEDAHRLAMAIVESQPFELRFRPGNADFILRHVENSVLSAPALSRSRILPISAFLRGPMAPGIPAIIDVASDILQIPEAKELTPFSLLARSAGFCLPLEDTCYLTERPEFIRTDERGQLHADEGPAVAWPGGAMPMWRWHGIETAEHVMAPVSAMDASSIRRERSVILRDIMIERFGLERFIRECGAKRLQQDETGIFWEVRNPLPRRRICVVEVVNGTQEPDGSFRHYFLRVPSNIRTARGAVAWSYGLTSEQYRVKVRT